MRSKRITFNLLIPASAGILIFIYVFYGRTGIIPALEDNFLAYLIALIAGLCIGFVMMRIDRYFRNFWDRKLNVAYFLTLQLTIKYVAAILIVTTVTLGFLMLTTTFNFTVLWLEYYDEIIKILILTSVMMLIYSLTSFTLQSYNFYAYHQLEKMRQERDQVELQFEALKGQLSPHYLFNCLNTISSLVHHGANQTEDFIRRMAKTFQYVLTNDEKQLVTVAEELEFVKAYNYLLKVRFQNYLSIRIDIPKYQQQSFIPPLTLQMLLENAVKHNVIDEENQLTVTFTADDSKIYVKNNKTIKSSEQESFNIGLDNIKKRYRYLCGESIQIKDRKKFEVHLPMIFEKEVAHA